LSLKGGWAECRRCKSVAGCEGAWLTGAAEGWGVRCACLLQVEARAVKQHQRCGEEWQAPLAERLWIARGIFFSTCLAGVGSCPRHGVFLG